MNDGHILFQVRLSVFVIPDLIRRHPELDSGQMYAATLIAWEWIHLPWIKFRMTNRVQDDESSLGWRIEFRMTNQVWDELPSASLKWGWVPIIIPNPHILNHINTDFELWNTFRRKPIMHYKALYNVRACVCVWGVLNHLNPFYGDCGSFTVKTGGFTVKKRRFSMRKAAVLISNITNVAEYDWIPCQARDDN